MTDPAHPAGKGRPPAELNICRNPLGPGTIAPPCGLARFLVNGFHLCPRCDAPPHGARPTWAPEEHR